MRAARRAADARRRRTRAGVNTASVEETVEFFDRFIAERAKFFNGDCHVLIENQARRFRCVSSSIVGRPSVGRAHA